MGAGPTRTESTRREVHTVAPHRVLRSGRVVVDLVTRRVVVAGRPGHVRLTGRELELLCDLIAHDGVVRTRADLMDAVWDIAFPTSTSVVDVTMHRLRVKLDVEELQSCRSTGFRFVSHPERDVLDRLAADGLRRSG